MSDQGADWHGWERTNSYNVRRSAPRLHIGPLPRRKRIALYEQNGSTLNTLAYFHDEESARRAMDLLDHITGVRESKQQ